MAGLSGASMAPRRSFGPLIEQLLQFFRQDCQASRHTVRRRNDFQLDLHVSGSLVAARGK
jgi:hypothetical protein